MTDNTPDTRKRRLLPIAISTTVLVAVLVGGLFAWNYVSVQSPMQEVLEADPRNAGIEVRVHSKHYVIPGTLVYDLREVGKDKAPIDVFRVFLQFADAVKDKRFDSVELAFRGKTKFILDGSAFHEIGQEYAGQNPMYTVRTFPERLRTPEGRQAFGQWEGGALGVVGAQLEDFNEFQRQWYIDEL